MSEMGSRWDSMELKRGSVPIPIIETMDSEVSKKWTEFENLSFRDMSAQSLIGAYAYQSSTLQASQTHANSHINQLSPQEPRQSVTVSETDISIFQASLLSINGSQASQTNTDEAQREVRKNSQSGRQIIIF